MSRARARARKRRRRAERRAAAAPPVALPPPAAAPAEPRRLLQPGMLRRSAKTALVVGTILMAINHFDAWGHMTPRRRFQIGLTYLVPFSVATYGQIMGARAARRQSECVRRTP